MIKHLPPETLFKMGDEVHKVVEQELSYLRGKNVITEEDLKTTHNILTASGLYLEQSYREARLSSGQPEKTKTCIRENSHNQNMYDELLATYCDYKYGKKSPNENKKTERELIDYDHATILLWGAKQVVPISKIEKRNGVLTPKTHGGLLGSSLCYRKETGQSFLLGKGVNASPLNMNAISYNKWGCRFYSSGEDIIIQTLNPDGSLFAETKVRLYNSW